MTPMDAPLAIIAASFDATRQRPAAHEGSADRSLPRPSGKLTDITRSAMERMNRAIFAALAALGFTASCSTSQAHAGEGVMLLAPVPDAKGQARVQKSPDGAMLPVVRRMPESPLAQQAQTRLAQGVAAILPALDREARSAAARDTLCPEIGAQLLIYFSAEDGGYARQGFYFVDDRGRETFCNDHYVDLTVDQRSIDSGEFEEVLAHEWGHVLLRRLFGPLPPTPSRKFHSVLAITDPVTAFDEGIGIHFQPIAARLTSTTGFQRRIEGTAPPSAADFWFSRRETGLRHMWVQGNQLIHARLPVAGGAPYDRWLADERATALDPCRLRSGDELVASEGFVATFLYKWMAQQTADGWDAATVQRAYSRLIQVLARMENWHEKDVPVIALIDAWSRAYPEDRASIIGLFLALSHGATAAPEVRRAAEAASCAGSKGDMAAFGPALGAARTAQAGLVDAVMSGQTRIGAALGPQLWIARADVTIAKAPWMRARTQPLTLNLNSASEPELTLALDGRGFAPEIGARIVTERQDRGPFADLAALQQRLALDDAQGQLLAAMMQAYRTLPPSVRQ